MQDCHDSTSKEFPLLLYPLPGEAGESDFRSPPTSVSIGCLVAGVIKAPPPSLWDHSEAISGSAGASEEGPRCILGFVVHLQDCSLRVGPRHTGNYNPQQPGEEQREVGARITWELGLGGLVLGAAAAAAQRTGAFCLERRRGPGSARPAACPCLLGPGRPSRGWGPPLGPGLALGAAAPPLARPARPEGRNRPGLPARPRAISGVAATALRAPDQRLPLAPQADAMKIKDAKKPCKMGVWVSGWESTSGRVWKALGRAACFETGCSRRHRARDGGGGMFSAPGSRLSSHPPKLSWRELAAPLAFSRTSS